jgi:NADPH-dependent curcumin reductase CurA
VQIAKAKGCRVIGIPGGELKCRYDEFDAVLRICTPMVPSPPALT